MLTLVRYASFGTVGAGGILGKLYHNGQLICHTLENLGKAIPAGCYALQNSKSPKFKREIPLVYSSSVPATRGIRIHAGNTFKDSAGCILVGMGVNSKSHALTESLLAETMVTMLCRNDKEFIIVAA